jgi:hypothetical protein
MTALKFGVIPAERRESWDPLPRICLRQDEVSDRLTSLAVGMTAER